MRWRGTAVAIALLSLIGLALMAVRYADGTGPGRVDALFDGPLSLRGSDHRWVLERLIDLGDPLPAAALTVALAGAAAVTRRWNGAVLAVFAPVVAGGVAQFVLKPWIGRTDDDGLVFPSGHATVFAGLGAVFVVLLLDARTLRPAARWVLALLVLILVAAKSVALAATGYHYLTDGVGGVLLAIGAVLLIALVLDVLLLGGAYGRELPPSTIIRQPS